MAQYKNDEEWQDTIRELIKSFFDDNRSKSDHDKTLETEDTEENIGEDTDDDIQYSDTEYNVDTDDTDEDTNVSEEDNSALYDETPDSPLPPLIIEVVPTVNKHDESNEYYEDLVKRLRFFCRKMIVEGLDLSIAELETLYEAECLCEGQESEQTDDNNRIPEIRTSSRPNVADSEILDEAVETRVLDDEKYNLANVEARVDQGVTDEDSVISARTSVEGSVYNPTEDEASSISTSCSESYRIVTTQADVHREVTSGHDMSQKGIFNIDIVGEEIRHQEGTAANEEVTKDTTTAEKKSAVEKEALLKVDNVTNEAVAHTDDVAEEAVVKVDDVAEENVTDQVTIMKDSVNYSNYAKQSSSAALDTSIQAVTIQAEENRLDVEEPNLRTSDGRAQDQDMEHSEEDSTSDRDIEVMRTPRNHPSRQSFIVPPRRSSVEDRRREMYSRRSSDNDNEDSDLWRNGVRKRKAPPVSEGTVKRFKDPSAILELWHKLKSDFFVGELVIFQIIKP